MLLQPLFADFLAREKLNLDHDAIANYCLELNQKQKASESGMPIVLQLHEAPLRQLFSTVKEKFNEVHNKISLSQSAYQEVMMGWININHAISPQEPHAHDDYPNLVLTAVYYPRVEKNGSNLNFMCSNPARKFVIYQKDIGTYNEYNSKEWYVTPETGDLIIFPSWMVHYVSINRSNKNEQRISIALNSKIVPKRI